MVFIKPTSIPHCWNSQTCVAWEDSDVTSCVQDFQRSRLEIITSAAASIRMEVRAYPERRSWLVNQAYKPITFSRVFDSCRRLRHHKPSVKFRTKFIYNNYMYALVGHVTEVLQGGQQKWEDIIRERIFKPLGMTSSTFAQRFEDWDTLATPYVLYGDEIRDVEKRLIRWELADNLPILWVALIPAWISNYVHCKVWDEITYPFPNFNGGTVEVWEWISNFIPPFTSWACDYISMLGLKLNHVSNRGPWCFHEDFVEMAFLLQCT